MFIYSDTITRADLDAIATHLGMVLYNADKDFSGARARRISTTIRPAHAIDHPLDIFRAKRHGRRIWAISWAGHYAFMSAVFALDPDARIKSALDHWRGQQDFHERAPDSGTRNVGSIAAPVAYSAAEAGPMRTLSELRQLGEAAAREARRYV